MAHMFFTNWRQSVKPVRDAMLEADPADLGTELGLEARLGTFVPPLQSRHADDTRGHESLGERLESVFSHYGI